MRVSFLLFQLRFFASLSLVLSISEICLGNYTESLFNNKIIQVTGIRRGISQYESKIIRVCQVEDGQKKGKGKLCIFIAENIFWNPLNNECGWLRKVGRTGIPPTPIVTLDFEAGDEC